ncbi:Septum site-determining protein MinD [compost metagenome]
MLPAAQTKDKNAVSPEQVRDIILELKKEYEYVIIDCPAGIEQGFKNAIAGADQAIVVTTPEHAAVRDADRIIGLLESSHIKSPKLVVNRIRVNMVKSGDMLDIDGILQVLNIDLIGIVPDDELVIKAANSGEPTVMNPDSKAAIAYRNIARRILGDTVPLMQLDQKKGAFTRFKKFFGMG